MRSLNLRSLATGLLAMLATAPAVVSGGFTMGVRDSIMIAHAFKGEEFGPAQKLHGATYTVDVEFKTETLAPRVNWVLDIGEALDTLGKVLQKYNFQNLDEIFPEDNTTTEFMCRAIHGDLAKHYGALGFNGAINVKLWESHKAWASYEAAVGKGAEQCASGKQ